MENGKQCCKIAFIPFFHDVFYTSLNETHFFSNIYFVIYKCVQFGLTPGGHKLEHRNKEAHLQNSSSLKMEGIQLWYLVCSISLWTSTKLFIWCPWDQDWPRCGVTNLNIGTKKAKYKILPHCTWKVWSFDFWYAALPCGPLSISFIWYPWSQNWPHPRGHKLEQ